MAMFDRSYSHIFNRPTISIFTLFLHTMLRGSVMVNGWTRGHEDEGSTSCNLAVMYDSELVLDKHTPLSVTRYAFQATYKQADKH